MGETRSNQVIDDILKELGTGKFQVIYYIFVCMPIMFTTFSGTNFIFTARDTTYRCSVPECETNSSFDQPWLSYALPFNEALPDKCKRFPFYNASGLSKTNYTRDSSNFDNSTVVQCTSWVYGEGDSIVTGFGMPCEDWKLSLVGTINMVGQLISLLVSGFLSDKYGRRNMMVVMTASSGVIGLAQSFSTNYWVFAALEFLNLAASDGAFMIAYVLGVEILSADKRVYGCAIIDITGATSTVLVGVIAWALESWRAQLRATTTPALFLLVAFFVIPESVRWLYTKKRYQECSKILKGAAKINGISLSPEMLDQLKNLSLEHTKLLEEESAKGEAGNNNSSILSVLKSPQLFSRLLICMLCWLTNGFVYYGLAINSVNLLGRGSSPYWNFVVVASAELPSTFLYVIILRFIGRKYALQFNLLASGLCCIMYAIVPNIGGVCGLLLFWLGKLFISMSFSIIYIVTSELFPTCLRNSTMNVCSVIGRVGAGLAPQALLLSKVHETLPALLFGTISILCGLIVLRLPETKNKTLPNTTKEAEDLK